MHVGCDGITTALCRELIKPVHQASVYYCINCRRSENKPQFEVPVLLALVDVKAQREQLRLRGAAPPPPPPPSNDKGKEELDLEDDAVSSSSEDVPLGELLRGRNALSSSASAEKKGQKKKTDADDEEFVEQASSSEDIPLGEIAKRKTAAAAVAAAPAMEEDNRQAPNKPGHFVWIFVVVF